MLVGSMFLSAKVFFTEVFAQGFSDNGFIFFESFALYLRTGGFGSMFTYFYVGLVLFILLLSLGGVLDKSMFIYNILAAILSMISLSTVIGVMLLINK